MPDVILSGAVRNNLLSLQSTADLLGKTQERLATGLRVNSALDDPTAFFTAASLNSRAGDLNRLLDSVGLAIQTLEAADNAISAITDLVESAQATARQALQASQATFGAAAQLTGASATATSDQNQVIIGTGTLDTSGGAGSFTVNGTTVNYAQNDTAAQVAGKIDTAMTGAGISITAADVGGDIRLTAGNADTAITLGGANLAQVGLDTTNETTAQRNLLTQSAVSQGETLTVKIGTGSVQTITFGTGTGEVSTLAELNTALDGLTGVNTAGTGVDGSNNVDIQAATAGDSITVGGTATLSAFGISAGITNPTVSANSTTRANLETEYNALRTQIDQLAGDAQFNGINLLQSDNLQVIFNESGTSSLTIAGVDFDSSGLSVSAAASGAFQHDAEINATLDQLDSAIATLRSQAATFGSNLSVVETRQSFTENLINTLETGAANLTLADTNEEGANLLALQTRQQLSSVALSLASSSDQNVLRLF